MIRLQADRVEATVDPDGGGRLISLIVEGKELLLPPRDGLDLIPLSGSFVLAPWVGEIAHGELTFRVRTYRLPVNRTGHAVHGLVATGPWLVEAESGRTVTMSRRLTEPWPFGGRVVQSIVLAASHIVQEVSIQADAAAMPAAIGWHDFDIQSAADALDLIGQDRTEPPVMGPNSCSTGRGGTSIDEDSSDF